MTRDAKLCGAAMTVITLFSIALRGIALNRAVMHPFNESRVSPVPVFFFFLFFSPRSLLLFLPPAATADIRGLRISLRFVPRYFDPFVSQAITEIVYTRVGTGFYSVARIFIDLYTYFRAINSRSIRTKYVFGIKRYNLL